jgi:hypothetical protein
MVAAKHARASLRLPNSSPLNATRTPVVAPSDPPGGIVTDSGSAVVGPLASTRVPTSGVRDEPPPSVPSSLAQGVSLPSSTCPLPRGG